MRKVLLLPVLLAATLAVVAAEPSRAITPPPPGNATISVLASDGGGWSTFPPNQPCGVFHAYFTTTGRSGQILNPLGGGSVSLEYGTTDYSLLLTGTNAPGSAHTLTLTVDGVSVSLRHLGYVEPPIPPDDDFATTVIAGRVVTVRRFYFLSAAILTPKRDSVGACQAEPDGVTDSYAQFTVTVSPPSDYPPAIDDARIDSTSGDVWRSYATADGCVINHGFAVAGADPRGRVLDPTGDLAIPLYDGTATYGVLVSGADKAQASQQLRLRIDGQLLTLGEGPIYEGPFNATTTIVVRGRQVAISSFRMDTTPSRPVVDQVGPCQATPDGVTDSYATFVVKVTDLAPGLGAVRLQAGTSSWRRYPDNGPCADPHAFLLAGTDPARSGVVNPELVSTTLSIGTSSYTVLGTFLPPTITTASGTMTVTVEGASATIFESPVGPDQPTTATFQAKGKAITVGNLRPLSGKAPVIDRVGPCHPLPDGKVDYYRLFDVTVTLLPPASSKVDQVSVSASGGGGWSTYSTDLPCGEFRLFVQSAPGSRPGVIYNALHGDAAVSFAGPATTIGLIGTDGVDPSAALVLQVSIDGVAVELGRSAEPVTVVAGGRRVTVSDFQMDVGPGRPAVDRVGACTVGSDGFRDSTGSFVVSVLDG